MKEKRKQAGLTQKQLASETGISLRTLQDYEQGRRNIEKANIQTVASLADALNCDIREFCTFRN